MKCPACGTECVDYSRFCNICGSSLVAKPAEVEKKPREKKISFGKIAPLARGILLLAVALILLVTAFTPILRLDFGEVSRDLDGYYYDVSPVETVVIFANSLYNLTDEEIADTRLYDRLQDVVDDLGDALNQEKFEDLSKQDQRDAKKLITLTVRLAVRHEDTVSAPSILLAAILSIAYIALGILAFVFAVINFVAYFTGRGGCFSLTATLSVFAAMLLPVLHYSICNMLSGSSADISFTEDMYRVGAGVVISLIAIGIFVAYCIVERIFLAKDSISIKRYVVNAVVVILCIVMLILVAAPVVGITAETELSGKSDESEITVNLGSTFYNNFELTEKAIEELYDEMGGTSVAKESYVSGIVNRFGLYTSSDIRRGKADHVAVSILTYTLIYGFAPDAVRSFACTQVFTVLAAALVAVVLARAVIFFVLGEKRRRTVDIICSMAAAISTIGQIVFISIHTVSVNNILGDCGVKAGDLSAHICAAPIVLAVLAVLVCVAVYLDKAHVVAPVTEDAAPVIDDAVETEADC